MRTRRNTCGDCGRPWTATADWCGRCGARLTPQHRPGRERSFSSRARAQTALATIAGLIVVLAFAVGNRPATVPAATAVDVLPSTATGAALEPLLSGASRRCRTPERTVDCVRWSSDAAMGDAVPVHADNVIVAVVEDGVAGLQPTDGTLIWRTTDVDPIIWLYAATEDAEFVLAVDNQRRLLVVRAADGVVTAVLERVRPVFPGIVDNHLAILRGGVTDVIDVMTGAVVLSVRRPDSFPSGRLIGGERFASWQDLTVSIHDVTGASIPTTVELDLAPLEIAGSATTVVATLSDGSIAAVDVASGALRWRSVPAVSDREHLLVGTHFVATSVKIDGTDTVRLLDIDTGRVDRHLGIAQVIGFRALADGEILVLHEGEDDRLELLVLSPRGAAGDRSGTVAGGRLPVVMSPDRAMVSGDRGAEMIDLRTGDSLWILGQGEVDAVGAVQPIVWDDELLFGVDLPSMP